MKTGQLFWGFFFITLGALFMIERYDLAMIDYSVIWDLWPFFFVFWGLAVIFKNSKVNSLFYILWGILVSFIIFGGFQNLIYTDFECDSEFSSISSDIHEEYNSDYEFASLIVDGGAGKFKIEEATDELWEANVSGLFTNYHSNTIDSDNRVESHLTFDDEFSFWDGELDNKLYLKLNENPVWDFEFNFGASKSVFDLREFKVRLIDISAGATDMFVRVGDDYPKTKIKIQMGASSTKIEIPKSSGCKVISESFLVVRDLPGFTKKDEGTYVNNLYGIAENNIIIDLEGGVSNFRIVYDN